MPEDFQLLFSLESPVLLVSKIILFVKGHFNGLFTIMDNVVSFLFSDSFNFIKNNVPCIHKNEKAEQKLRNYAKH